MLKKNYVVMIVILVWMVSGVEKSIKPPQRCYLCVVSDLKYNTVIGPDGQGVSQGQRQRILIARAVYKDPSYLFFDEATNSLDANNERAIVENLTDFYRGKTVIIVAHRLSTVRNADQIVVLDKGRIVEVGTHDVLIDRKGAYYNLVKNQLELGN